MENSQPDSMPSDIASARQAFSWRKKFLLFLALAVAAYAFAEWQDAAPRDPKYKGRRLSAWLSDMGHGSGTFALTRDDFRAMGPAGVNWLIWASEHGHLPPVRNRKAPLTFPIRAVDA